MKMKCKNSLMLAIALWLIFNLSLVYALELNQHPYFKKINVPQSTNEPAIIKLDYQILNYMKPDGSDLRITEDGQEVPLKTIISAAEELTHKSKIIAASSTRSDFRGISYDTSNLVDGDYSNNDNAYYQIDSIKDLVFGWFIVELPASILTDKAIIWSLNNDYTWTEVQIEGSNDNNNWVTIKSKSKYDIAEIRTITFPPVEYKFLRFSFWHTQSLVLNEIEIYGAYNGQAIFYARSGKDYKFYYGNKQAPKPDYDVTQLFTKKTTPVISLGVQQNNPSFNFDNDGDGILSDNCPTVSNPDQMDTDADGIGNVCDNCPDKANSDQKDSDNDGVGDACDNCYLNYNPDQYDDNLNGKGYICDDNDNDGMVNSVDNCVSVANPSQSDKDRNGVGDACEDIDNDGIPFSRDNCLNKHNPDQKDSDKDKIGDECDNCLDGYNPTQFDKNNNGIGDACEDDDNDGVENYRDNCLKVFNNDQRDPDLDGIGDLCDNCPSVKNPEQYDSDNNGVGDVCDDTDKDGIINTRDNCPGTSNSDQKDQNNNAVGDACEDYDNDGVMNFEDNCLYEHNPKRYIGNEYAQSDVDRDGKGDACDEKDSRITERKGLIWLVISGTILIVGILAWRLSRKPLK